MAVEDTLDRIIAKNKERNAQRSSQITELQRHGEIVDLGLQQQETIVKVVRSLVSFLERHTSKTEVTNQLESIGTPDALKVVTAVEDLHKTLKTHENTDLTEITDVMKQVLTELEQVPKEYQDITIPETVKVSNMPDHSKDMKALLEAVKAIKLVAEAPQVTVEPTPVQIDPTDVSPVTGAVEKATKAIKGIVIPQPESLKTVEKLIRKTNSLLDELLDASPGGGGGGGSSWVAVDENDKPTPLQLNSAGDLLVSSPAGGATLEEQQDQTDILEMIESAVNAIAHAKGISADLRVTVVGGSLAISSGTITTVTTVAGITNIGGQPANQIVPANQNVAVVLSNINNIGA